jgi:hypothetical protein
MLSELRVSRGMLCKGQNQLSQVILKWIRIFWWGIETHVILKISRQMAW